MGVAARREAVLTARRRAMNSFTQDGCIKLCAIVTSWWWTHGYPEARAWPEYQEVVGEPWGERAGSHLWVVKSNVAQYFSLPSPRETQGGHGMQIELLPLPERLHAFYGPRRALSVDVAVADV
jgi:hypothetical protein